MLYDQLICNHCSPQKQLWTKSLLEYPLQLLILMSSLDRLTFQFGYSIHQHQLCILYWCLWDSFYLKHWTQIWFPHCVPGKLHRFHRLCFYNAIAMTRCQPNTPRQHWWTLASDHPHGTSNGACYFQRRPKSNSKPARWRSLLTSKDFNAYALLYLYIP